jgi:Raf kinase inhibitor-like YbhB/YbcL family protein
MIARMRRIILVLALGATACGSDSKPDIDGPPGGGEAPPIDAPVDGSSGAFALTSPELTEGAMFNAANTCNGANTSPALNWADPPAGTMGFAIVFTDKSNNLVHWVIYDIPSTLTGLPADVDKVFAPPDVAGAHQTASFQANVRGYLGPCPPVLHTYEFAIHALDVATLPGATMQTNRAQAIAIIDMHRIGTPALLTGMYMQP